MRRGRALGGGAAILAAALALGPARAQDASGQSLYSEGLSAYEAGDLSVACERFRKSFELDERPAPLFMLAKCSEKQGKTATALAHYESVLRLGGLKPALRDEAVAAVSRLGPIVPKVVVKQGSAPLTAVARLDGRLVVADEIARPIDPGPHQLEVEAAGFEPYSTAFSVEASVTATVTLEVGASLSPQAPSPSSGRLGSFIGGGVASGVGLVGLLSAAATGGVILDQCGGSLGCEQRVVTGEPSDALVVGNAVSWGLGLVGAGVGIGLLIHASISGQPAPAAVSAGPDGVRLRF